MMCNLLHEFGGHVKKAANSRRATRGAATAASAHVHLESHLRCGGDDVLLVRVAGSVAIGTLLI